MEKDSPRKGFFKLEKAKLEEHKLLSRGLMLDLPTALLQEQINLLCCINESFTTPITAASEETEAEENCFTFSFALCHPTAVHSCPAWQTAAQSSCSLVFSAIRAMVHPSQKLHFIPHQLRVPALL